MRRHRKWVARRRKVGRAHAKVVCVHAQRCRISSRKTGSFLQAQQRMSTRASRWRVGQGEELRGGCRRRMFGAAPLTVRRSPGRVAVRTAAHAAGLRRRMCIRVRPTIAVRELLLRVRLVMVRLLLSVLVVWRMLVVVVVVVGVVGVMMVLLLVVLRHRSVGASGRGCGGVGLLVQRRGAAGPGERRAVDDGVRDVKAIVGRARHGPPASGLGDAVGVARGHQVLVVHGRWELRAGVQRPRRRRRHGAWRRRRVRAAEGVAAEEGAERGRQRGEVLRGRRGCGHQRRVRMRGRGRAVDAQDRLREAPELACRRDRAELDRVQERGFQVVQLVQVDAARLRKVRVFQEHVGVGFHADLHGGEEQAVDDQRRQRHVRGGHVPRHERDGSRDAEAAVLRVVAQRVGEADQGHLRHRRRVERRDLGSLGGCGSRAAPAADTRVVHYRGRLRRTRLAPRLLMLVGGGERGVLRLWHQVRLVGLRVGVGRVRLDTDAFIQVRVGLRGVFDCGQDDEHLFVGHRARVGVVLHNRGLGQDGHEPHRRRRPGVLVVAVDRRRGEQRCHGRRFLHHHSALSGFVCREGRREVGTAL
mmetsp:Transcript_52421/g.161395  ORF Transcript_52421/g.161395 Transcript_52421/m.161395 type:complete len:586 (-) Transcript_52421:303-2060(-)